MVAPSGDCNRLLATAGSWRLLAPGDSWRVLVTASGFWRLQATPGVVCILVVSVVPNEKYNISCKEQVQAKCKITSKKIIKIR